MARERKKVCHAVCKSFGGQSYFTIAVLCVFLLAVAAWAEQDHPVPRGEVFVGYSWLNPGGDTTIGHLKSLNKGYRYFCNYQSVHDALASKDQFASTLV